MADEKQSEAYSLTLSTMNKMLSIHLLEADTKRMYHGLFSAAELQKCGFNNRMACDVGVITNFMQKAKKKEGGLEFAVTSTEVYDENDNNEGKAETAVIKITKDDDLCPLEITMQLYEVHRDRTDMLFDHIKDLKKENQALKARLDGIQSQLNQQQSDNAAFRTRFAAVESDDTSLRTRLDAAQNESQAARSSLNQLTTEFETFKRTMTWRPFTGNAFDKRKEYRVRMNQGGGYYAVGYFDSQALYFSVSTANFYYGCIEIGNRSQWHYRHKGNSASKANGGQICGNVYCIEERG